MFAQTTFVPTNYFAVGTPTGWGGAHVLAYSYMHFYVSASASDALAGGAARVPMCFYATHLKYITVFIRSAHTGNKLVSALVPRPPPLPERAEHPFPS